MFVSKKRFKELEAQVKELQQDRKADRVFIKSVSSRVSAIKPSLRKTFGFLANEKTVDSSSNGQIAKWLEENL